MKRISVIGLVLLFCFPSQANLIQEGKDWRAYKDIPTVLDGVGCVAETEARVDVDDRQEVWVLQVIRLQSGGEYTYPIFVAFPRGATVDTFFEARAKSDKEDTQEFYFMLLQPTKTQKNIVAGRLRNRLEINRRLQNDRTFTVDFMNHEGSVRKVEYSLSGSYNAISAIGLACS